MIEGQKIPRLGGLFLVPGDFFLFFCTMITASELALKKNVCNFAHVLIGV
jgi:hypothetical protein